MIKVNGKWRFAPVVERDGNIVRDLVLINGAEENHSEGRYYLEWHEVDDDGEKAALYLKIWSPLRGQSLSSCTHEERACCLRQSQNT
jgi:hypothetical protein